MGKAPITFEQLGNEKAIRKARPNGTEIDKGIDACIKELSSVRAERKIMIILTDGSCYLPEIKEAHKRAVAAGIEPLGITLGNYGGNMETVFGKNKNRIIEDTKNKKLIGTAFIDILKESVKIST